MMKWAAIAVGLLKVEAEMGSRVCSIDGSSI